MVIKTTKTRKHSHSQPLRTSPNRQRTIAPKSLAPLSLKRPSNLRNRQNLCSQQPSETTW